MPGTKRAPYPEDLNTAHAILDCLENEGPLSRAAIAKKLGLSRTTLSNFVTVLIDQGLVSEKEEEDPQGRGRPGIPVDLDAERWFALGAVFHSGRWVFAVVNLKGEVVYTTASGAIRRDAGVFLRTLVKGVGAVKKRFAGRLLPAVGVGAPGLVNWETGVIITADDLGWSGIDVRGDVEKATGLHAYVINRNRAAGIAEARYGLGRNAGGFIYIGVGTGISAAIMQKGRLWHGASYSAGEIGHMTVDPKGPLCGCGKRGCLQTLAAESALLGQARELYGAGRIPEGSPLAEAFAGGDVDAERLGGAAAEGDAVARACIEKASAHLGLAVGNLITAFNPDKVILGGPLVRNCPGMVECTRAAAAEVAMRHPFSFVEIAASALDEYAGALGAACLVLRNKMALSANQS